MVADDGIDPASRAHDLFATRLAGDAQLVEAFQPAALAFPVADGVIDKLQGAVLPEVGDGKDRLEDGLQAGILTVLSRHIHLQETLIRALLNLNEVRNGNGRGDLGKIDPLAGGPVTVAGHVRQYP